MTIQHYNDVKTRRQLDMEIPAGFRHLSETQHQYNNHLDTKRVLSPTNEVLDDQFISSFSTSTMEESNLPDSSSDVHADQSSPTSVPILRCVDKPSSSLPSWLTYTEEFVRANVGFCHIDTLKAHLPDLYQHTVSLDSLPPDAVLDQGDFSMLKKSARNTTPVPRPAKFGEVIHMDIIFGPDVVLGNVHYGVLFMDRFSHMTYIYPLQNLASDIPRQLDMFFARLRFSPKRLISDFDTKLIGGKAREFLNHLKFHIKVAPANRQDCNGLTVRHWQTMTAMARNWLALAELPAKFWFYAVKRAVEVGNYSPMKLEDGSWTTPLELAHKVKPDLRVLFKMFGLAAVSHEHAGDNHLGKFEAQSVPMIAVGRCSNSNGLLFYNPAKGTFVSY